MRAAPREVDEIGLGRLEVWDLEPSEEILRRLLTDLFEHRWRELTFGPLIQGSAWEITAPPPARHLGATLRTYRE